VDSDADERSRLRTVWFPRIIITIGLVAAFGAFAVALRSANTGGQEKQFDLAVESVFPTQDSLEPRQTTVQIDLANGWAVEQFWIQGIQLEDRLINSSGASLGQYFFSPGEGTPFPLFQPGEIDVLVVIFNELDPSVRRNITWSFRAT